MTSNFRNRLFAAGAAIVGTAAAFLLAELGLRIIGFEFDLYPTRVQFGWPDPVTIERRYEVDRELLWVPKDYQSEVASSLGKRPSVVFMGDSCTEFGRYDEHLDSIITRRDPDSNFTYVNLGVGGWSSFQGLVQMKRDVVRLQPSVATIYFGWNDHWRSFGIVDKEIGDFYRAYPPLLLAMSRARVVQLVNKGILALRADSAPAHKTPERVSLDDFESNLTSIVQIARDNGIIPVLLTAPTSHEVGKEPDYLVPRWLHDLSDLVPLHRRYVQVVRDVSVKQKVILIDLFDEFSRMSSEERARYFNDDGIHLNDAGNRRIAEMIYEHLRYRLPESAG